MRIAEGLARDRHENNFNLIRITAALVVLVSHSFVIATGDPAREPLRIWLGTTPGTIAVDVFFITSGFLVTKSLLDRGSFKNFVLARFLRIYPAMIVMTLLTVLIFGLLFSSEHFLGFIENGTTTKYILKNISIVSGPSYQLPGVFDHNLNTGIVNGSLWSMKFELWMYILLVLLWSPTRILGNKVNMLFMGLCIACASIAFIFHMINQFRSENPEAHQLAHLMYMFFSGSTFYILRKIITVKWTYLLAFSAILVASVFFRPAFTVVYALSIAPIVFGLAYLPGGKVWNYNKIGDFSYGVYIYAYPVEQTIAYFAPHISPLWMTIAAIPPTLILAVLSWRLIEERALRLKR